MPSMFLFGAGAQFGIFFAICVAVLLGFDPVSYTHLGGEAKPVPKPKAVAEKKAKVVCPECGEPLSFEGGCNICKNCRCV